MMLLGLCTVLAYGAVGYWLLLGLLRGAMRGPRKAREAALAIVVGVLWLPFAIWLGVLALRYEADLWGARNGA